jgi:hypothetical protein
MFNQNTEIEASESKQMNGLDDRLVISVDIKVQRYLQYTLDAQLDTGAMNSCAKYGAIHLTIGNLLTLFLEQSIRLK